MFTWICPQCGREVPPSYSECPTCAERRATSAAGAAPAAKASSEERGPAAPPAQAQYAPATVTPPVQAQYAPTPAPQVQYAPAPAPQQAYVIAEPKKSMPTWLAAVLTIAVLGGGLFGLYRFVGRKSEKPPVAVVGEVAAPQAGSSTNPYARFIEIVGLRLVENEKKQPVLHYIVVNHSPAELRDVELTVGITSSNAAPGAEPIAAFGAKVGTLPANGTKEMEVLLKTTLKMYELPDWQFLRASFDIISPRP